MTQEQILKMDNLKVAEVKPNMFVHIHANDGYIITAWGEQEDIKEYSGSVCMYMPIRDNYDDDYRTITVADNYDDDYRTITVAEHQELEARHLEAMRLEEQKYNEMND